MENYLSLKDALSSLLYLSLLIRLALMKAFMKRLFLPPISGEITLRLNRQGDFSLNHISDLVGLHAWLLELSETDRLIVFALAVYLFGKAEGRVYRQEEKQWCNHWWHRDLLDERVVNAILNDPMFYTTAMKDDDGIKSRWRWLRGS